MNTSEDLYSNLTKCFSKVMDHILGDDYVNDSLDVYKAQRKASIDICNRYDEAHKAASMYQLLFLLASIVNLVLIAILI